MLFGAGVAETMHTITFDGTLLQETVSFQFIVAFVMHSVRNTDFFSSQYFTNRFQQNHSGRIDYAATFQARKKKKMERFQCT